MIGQLMGGSLEHASSEASFLQKGRVHKDLMDSLRDHGMRCPIRGIRDPRLEHPEMLIMTGWDREPLADGYRYTFVADEEADMRWQQVYEYHEDGTAVLHTQAGRKMQIVRESAEGSVTSEVKIL